MANSLIPRKQTITVDSTMAAKQITVKILQGARKRLGQDCDPMNSSDEEMCNFAREEITDEDLLQKELYKRLDTAGKKQERTTQASKRMVEFAQRQEALARKMEKARQDRLYQERKKQKAVDPLPAVPYWPTPQLSHVTPKSLWQCISLPHSTRSLLASTLFKLALNINAEFLSQHDAVSTAAVEVEEFQGGLHCVIHKKPRLAIDVVDGRAKICDTQH